MAEALVWPGLPDEALAVMKQFAEPLVPLLATHIISTADLRRTCARNAYENGASLLVQAMLGHEDPKTTAQYIGAFESDDDTAMDYVRY